MNTISVICPRGHRYTMPAAFHSMPCPECEREDDDDRFFEGDTHFRDLDSPDEEKHEND